MSGVLYLVGTPIGNLGDFSPRAIETLEQVDFIAAEDTRVTVKLLNHFGIKKPLLSYYEHNRQQRGQQILRRLLAGECCALVSDAGMPAISDPGEDLVAQCAKENIPVYAVPGPTAVATAVALSGLPTGRFTFEGFLSVNKKSRREHLQELTGEKRTMVFYEAPHKLKNTLQDLLDTLGDRRVALVRELTKVHEEVIRTTLSQLLIRYQEEAPKGELVLVLEGSKETAPQYTLADAIALAKDYMAQGQAPSEAAKQAAKETGQKKGEVYRGLIQNEE